jgi:hypothetical protein
VETCSAGTTRAVISGEFGVGDFERFIGALPQCAVDTGTDRHVALRTGDV